MAVITSSVVKITFEKRECKSNNKDVYRPLPKLRHYYKKSVDESVKWFRMNKLSVNIDKCHVMLISGRNTSRYSLNIDIDGVKIPHVRSAKYLGVVIDSELKWNDHINELSSRLSSRLYVLRKL